MNQALLWWVVTRVLFPLCVVVAVLTVADAVMEWWEGPK